MSKRAEVSTKNKTTIDALPDEILTEIFDYFKLKGQLRCSLVCKRWFDVVQNNVKLMRRLVFSLKSERDHQHFLTVPLRRVYRNVELALFKEGFNVVSAKNNLGLLLAGAECVQLFNCVFSLEEFQHLTSWCETARKFEMKDVQLIEARHNTGHLLVNVEENLVLPSKLGQVECVLEKCSFHVLDFFEKIDKLSVTDLRIGEKLAPTLVEVFAPVFVELDVHLCQISDRKIALEALDNGNLKPSALKINVEGKRLNAIELRQLDHVLGLHSGHVTSFCYLCDTQQEVFNMICKSLVNLESLEFRANRAMDLSGLKQLKKLRKFTLHHIGAAFDLNIAGATITELEIHNRSQNMRYTCQFPLVKRLNILIRDCQLSAIDQIPNAFPNLEELTFVMESALYEDFTPLNQLKALKTLMLSETLVFRGRLFDKLQLPELRKVMICGNVFTYDTRRIGLDTWKRLSHNCPKLTHIYQTPVRSVVPQKGRKMVAKRWNASGLISKIRPKKRQRDPLNHFERIQGSRYGNGRDVCEFDSSEGEVDNSIPPVTYSYSSSSESSMDEMELWMEYGAWWKADSDYWL